LAIETDSKDIEGFLKLGIENLLKLNEYFDTGNWADSRDLIGRFILIILLFQKMSFEPTRIN
jgi:site-specific DNA recombinase